MRVRKAESSSGLCFTALKARTGRSSRGVGVADKVFVVAERVTERWGVCESTTAVEQSRRDAGAESRMRCSMGVLTVRAMRKDSATGVSWRYSAGLLYLGCVCVAGSRQRQLPEKAGATDVNRSARWFLAIPDNKRYAKAR